MIHYVDDRRQVFREIHRVLKPGGHVVLSTHHPTLDWLRTGGSYFAEGIIEERWSRGWDMRYWRMPLGVASDEMTDEGFLIERIVEPTAVPELAEVDPEHYEELHRASIHLLPVGQTEVEAMSQARLIIVCGLPGSGKTTLARRLAEAP